MTSDFLQVLEILGVIAAAVVLVGVIALGEEKNRRKLKFLRFR